MLMMRSELIHAGALATIAAGHPIRGAVRETPGGDTAVVQIKNADADAGIDWSPVTRTTLSGRREPDWLRPGDVLFSARGQRNIAVCVEEPPARAVASPHFFLLRVKKGKPILPAFLAWQINLPEAQRYFAQSATGSYITSIRKEVLAKLPVRVPALATQQALVNLVQAARRERAILEELIENRQRELTIVARELLV